MWCLENSTAIYSETREQLKDAEARQLDLTKRIREVRRAGGDYSVLQQEFEETQKEVEELTRKLSEQRNELRESEGQISKWGSKMKWATGLVVLATGALTALIHVQGQVSRSLVNVADITGQAAETMERLNQAAQRLSGQGLAPEVWLGIADHFKQLNYQLKWGGDLSDEQYDAFSKIGYQSFSSRFRWSPRVVRSTPPNPS